MEKGKFIVLEGIDGAGKDTQIDLLRAKLPEERFLFVRDPGGTYIGEQIREIVLHDKRITRNAEFFLYLAMRVQLTEEMIKPALESGKHVISNRFDLSTISYQIYGRERKDLLPFLKQMSEFALGGVRPDVLIYIDCPPEVGLQRIAKAKALDRFEEEKLPFHERVREGYLTHIADYPTHYTVNGNSPITIVHESVMHILKEHVPVG